MEETGSRRMVLRCRLTGGGIKPPKGAGFGITTTATASIVAIIVPKERSGGAYIGQQLAKKLNIRYLGCDIIEKVAQQYSVGKESLDSYDESIPSWRESFLKFSISSSEVPILSPKIMPTTREIFNAESKIIKEITRETSAVVLGRCGFYVLRNYPNRVSIFLHADKDFRSNRIQGIYDVSEKTSLEMINRIDKQRSLYIETFTGIKWADAREFDLSIDTGKIDLDKSVEFILNYLKLR